MEKEALSVLILRYRDNDPQAAEELVLTVQQDIYYQCKKMLCSEQDALDATQDILISMLTKLDTLREPDAFWGWLNHMVANRCRNILTRGPREGQIPENEDGDSLLDTYEDTDEQTVPDKALDNEETRRMIGELVDSLPPAQRLCVLLYYYDELSVREIAQAAEVSENTVKSRLNYARKSIREGVQAYEKQGIKLYSLSPLPFLLYFLRQDSQSAALDGGAAKALAGAVLSASSGAATAAATAGGAAVSAGLSVKLVAGLLAGAVAIGGVSATVGAATARSKTEQAAQAEIAQIRQEKESAVEAVQLQLEQAQPDDLEDALAVLDHFLLEQTERDNRDWIEGLIGKAAALAQEGNSDWARLLIQNGLNYYPEDPALLEAMESLHLPTWLFHSYHYSGMIVSQTTLTSPAGILYDSGNTFRIGAEDANDYVSVALNSQYSSLTGILNLMRYTNGDESLRFIIKGDGAVLYERVYTSIGLESVWSGSLAPEDFDPETISLDVSGVDVLTIQFYGCNDSTTSIAGTIIGNSTIADIGMIDFLLR